MSKIELIHGSCADYPDYDIDVKLCAFSDREMKTVQKVFMSQKEV